MKKTYLVLLFVAMFLLGAGSEHFWDLTSSKIETKTAVDLNLKGGLLFNTDNTYDIGTTTVSPRVIYSNDITLDDDLTVGDVIILKNGEQIQNATDGIMSAVFNDSSATIGALYIESSLDTPSVVDNMAMEFLTYFNDDTSGLRKYSTIKTTATDVTAASIDSKVEMKIQVASTETTALTLDNGGAKVLSGLTAGTFMWGGTSTSPAGTDSFSVTITPAPSALAAGMPLYFKPDTANTGACVVNVNSLGWKAIKTASGSDPANSDLVTTTVGHLIYDGTNFLLLNPATTTD